MAREIVLDTETTGLDPRTGHRLIEIACVELENLVPTGQRFHSYIDPEREVDPEAERVHGLSTAFLAGKPRFADSAVVDALLAFIGEAPLIAHNAAFDRDFMNAELVRAGRGSLPEARWVDTLVMAQRRFPGMHNSLDALCRRYRISLAERERHGALVDAQLLADVYLELKGGRERRLDLEPEVRRPSMATAMLSNYAPRPRPLAQRITDAELAAHAAFIAELKGEIVWRRLATAA